MLDVIIAEYEQVCSRVDRSGHSAPHQVDTLGSISGEANTTLTLQAEQIMDAGPKRVSPQLTFQITETEEGGMMVITQMHDIVKTLQDRPENVKETFWSEGLWFGEELEKAWENYYEVQGCSPFATCGNDQCRCRDLCVLTSTALPSTSPSSPLHAPFNPSTPGSQVPGVDSQYSPLHRVSPSRGNASKTRASLPQATVEQKRRLGVSRLVSTMLAVYELQT